MEVERDDPKLKEFRVGDRVRIIYAGVDEDKIGQIRKVVYVYNGLVYLEGCKSPWDITERGKSLVKVITKLKIRLPKIKE